MPRHSRTLACLAHALPFLAVLLLYAQVRDHGYIDFDDMYYTYENPMVTRGLSWEGVRWAFSGSHVANYHPLTWLSHMLDFDLWGDSPGAFALTNAALHAANALLVSLLVSLVFRSTATGVVAGLVFAVHPQLVEAVAWISQRKTVLATFFALATMILYLLSRRSQSRRGGMVLFAGALATYAASLLAKGMYVTMPGILFLLELITLSREGGTSGAPPSRGGTLPLIGSLLRNCAIRLLPFAGLAVLVSVLTIWAQAGDNAVHTFEATPLSLRLATAVDGMRTYLSHFVYPSNLAVFYPRDETINLPAVAISTGLLLAISAGLVFASIRTGNEAILGWLMFLGMLLPVIGLIQVGEQGSADRYMYGPILGLLLAGGSLACLAQSITLKPVIRNATMAGLGMWITISAIAAHRQIGTWHNSYSLAVASEQSVGPVPQVLAIKATILNRAHRYTEAAAASRLGLEQAPTHLALLQNLAAAEFGLGHVDSAIAVLEHTVPLAPDLTGLYVNLAVFYAHAGRYDQSLATIALAREKQPATTSEAAILQSLSDDLKTKTGSATVPAPSSE